MYVNFYGPVFFCILYYVFPRQNTRETRLQQSRNNQVGTRENIQLYYIIILPAIVHFRVHKNI